MDREARNAHVGELWRLVKRHGWAVQHVLASGAGEVDYAYTVGLTGRGLPELVIFGLGHDAARSVLNAVAGRLVAGEQVEAPARLRGVVKGYDVTVMTVTDFQLLPLAFKVAGVPSIRALQIVWPDGQGRWPWEPGSGVATMPLLGAVPHPDG